MTDLLTRPPADLEIWSVKAMDAAHTRYTFKKMEGEKMATLVSLLSNATFTPDACDFLVMDLSFEEMQKRGTGRLIVRSKSQRRLVALHYKGNFANKRSLGFLECRSFEPERSNVAFTGNSDLPGIVLPGEFRNHLRP